MSDLITMNLLEVMASKICHDLISPIGAVHNGLEILEEMGAEAGPEVTGLIAYSTNQASAKLRAFRLVYGAGGADTNLSPQDAHTAIKDIISADGKITQGWNGHDDFTGTDYKRGYCKILTAALLMALDALPKGGEVKASGDENGFTITANGNGAALRTGIDKALGLSINSSALEPQLVHAALCGLIAQHYGFTLTAETAQDTVEFRAAVL